MGGGDGSVGNVHRADILPGMVVNVYVPGTGIIETGWNQKASSQLTKLIRS